MSDALRKLIRELVEQELEEVSTSGNAGPYNTPYAFRGNSAAGKEKAKKNAHQAGYEMVDKKQDKADDDGEQSVETVPFGEKGAGALKKPKKEEVVQENRYTEYKMSEGAPAQKIGKAIREINRQISEVDRMLRMNERLKKESGVAGDQLWKSTARGLAKLESRMNTLSARIRNLKA